MLYLYCQSISTYEGELSHFVVSNFSEPSINPAEDLTLQMNKTQDEKDSNKSVVRFLFLLFQ